MGRCPHGCWQLQPLTLPRAVQELSLVKLCAVLSETTTAAVVGEVVLGRFGRFWLR